MLDLKLRRGHIDLALIQHPRDFALLPFGGAGPMMGCFVARELDMARVLIPARPGVVSALGGLVADIRNDFIATSATRLAAASISDRLDRAPE